MKVKKVVVFILAIFLINCSNQTTKQTGEWIDLTYEFSEETIYWPTSDTFILDTVAEGKTQKVIITQLINFVLLNMEERI